MKTIQVGSLKIKVNAKGKATKTETIEAGTYTRIGGKYTKLEADTKVERDIYRMPFQSRNKVFKGSNGKNTFDPLTLEAVSYGHWCYVMKIKGKVVFNWYKYSNTTTGHQYEMSSLLKELGVKTYLKVKMAPSLRRFKNEALEPMYREMFELEVALNRKNSNPKSNRQRRAGIVSLKSDIVKARELGAVFSKASIEALQQRVLNEETSRLERLKKLSAERAALIKARRSIVATGETFELAAQ
jgi:hypothetical protein